MPWSVYNLDVRIQDEKGTEIGVFVIVYVNYVGQS